jgi:hypothetical protein
MSYAKGTSVSEQKSKMEIEALLKKYGADRFAYGWDEKNRALIERALPQAAKILPEETS